jgi:hypothetical protein
MDYNVYLANAKGITEADKKFINLCILPKLHEGRTLVTNPFSGWEGRTNVLIGTLVNFIQELERYDFSTLTLVKWCVPEGKRIQFFDRARMLVLKLDANIYSNVLD